MKFIFRSGLVIPEVTEDDIDKYVPGEEFATLEDEELTFVQHRIFYPWPDEWTVGYKRFRPKRRPLRKYPVLPEHSRDWHRYGYVLEYQEGSVYEHYRASRCVHAEDEFINMEMILNCYRKYLARDETWRLDFVWNWFDLSYGGKKKLGGQ